MSSCSLSPTQAYDVDGSNSIEEDELYGYFVSSLRMSGPPDPKTSTVLKSFARQIFESCATGGTAAEHITREDVYRFIHTHPQADVPSMFGRSMLVGEQADVGSLLRRTARPATSDHRTGSSSPVMAGAPSLSTTASARRTPEIASTRQVSTGVAGADVRLDNGSRALARDTKARMTDLQRSRSHGQAMFARQPHQPVPVKASPLVGARTKQGAVVGPRTSSGTGFRRK